MSFPKVSIIYSNGNLLQQIDAVDGIAGIVASANTTGNNNKIYTVFNLADAITQGLTQAAEPYAYKHIKEFYDQVGGNQELWVQLAPAATTMQNMLAVTVAETLATSTLTISAVGNDGDAVVFKVNGVTIGSYTKVTGDTTPTAVAQAIKAAINAGTSTHGYTASGNAAALTITAPAGTGSTANGATILNYGANGLLAFTATAFAGGVTGAPGTALSLIKAAGGRIRLLAITHKPYAAQGTDFLEADVQAALTASKTFGDACLALLMPCRMLLEGIIGTVGSTNVFAPKNASNGYAAIVIGTQNADPVTTPDYGASVGMVLGRAVKYAAHIKIGKVANGALNATQIGFANKKLEDMVNLEALHDAGYISFLHHPQKAGYYLGVDHMASTDDYRLLAYGRIVDKAAVITAAVYINELEGEVTVDGQGNISELDCKHLEGRITQQVEQAMADQISGFDVYIDPAQNIINTSRLAIKIRVRPKGYTTYITVDLGLTATGI